MKFIQVIVVFAFIMLSSCKEEKKVVVAKEESSLEISTFYLIRHAEKDRTNPNDVDPELSQKGLGRAMHWAEILVDANLDAIYTTDYNRSAMTAAPSSVKYDIDAAYFDPETLDVAKFMTDHVNKNVLVVGHSNTTPEMVNEMLGSSTYANLEDDDNGSMFVVKVVNGVATASKLRFNCNCPD